MKHIKSYIVYCAIFPTMAFIKPLWCTQDANCFLYFLDRNGLLYKNGEKLIDASTLATLTLLIAESKSEENQVIKQIVLSVLNRNN